MSEDVEGYYEPTLLDAFRLYYNRLESSITNIISSTSANDLIVVARLGDDIDEFSTLFNQVSLDRSL